MKMLEAVESSVNGGFSQLQSCGESSEEELSVLPRHTKVVVTGNNRTKSVLVGLQGVVKKAVGLGGWHWLVLTNGIEVKLQRNALSVIEAPTGNEEDDDLEFENVQWNGSEMTSDDTQKSHGLKIRTHKSSGSSHKTMSRSISCDSQSKSSVSTPRGSTKIDLSKLEMAALWRYWRHFNLVDSNPNPSREQLIDVVQRHFMSQREENQNQDMEDFPDAMEAELVANSTNETDDTPTSSEYEESDVDLSKKRSRSKKLQVQVAVCHLPNVSSLIEIIYGFSSED